MLDLPADLVEELEPADVVVARVREHRPVADVDGVQDSRDRLDDRARRQEAEPLGELVVRALVVAREPRRRRLGSLAATVRPPSLSGGGACGAWTLLLFGVRLIGVRLIG